MVLTVLQCREYSNTRAHPKAQALCAVLAGTKSDQSLKFILWQFLKSVEQKLQFHHFRIQKTRVMSWYPEKKLSDSGTRFMLTTQTPGPIPKYDKNGSSSMWTEHSFARHVCARTTYHRTQCTSTVTHHANTRDSSRLLWCVKSSLSSQRHVSHVAACVTEHFYTISLTHLTYLPTFFYLTVLSLGIGSRNPARFMAEWRIYEISHRLWAESDPIRRPGGSKNWIG